MDSVKLTKTPNRLGYLSGALRASTLPEASETGPRSHMLGVMDGFRHNGWDVFPYIVGDKVRLGMIHSDSSATMSRNQFTLFMSDVFRLLNNSMNQQKALLKLGDKVQWVYERLGAFQALGLPFHKKGIPWILETNAPLFYEAKMDRKSITLVDLARKIEIRNYQKCDVLVCISEVLKDIVIHEAGISERKIVVLPNGVDTERFNPESVTPTRQFLIPTLVFVGMIHKWQGLDLLIQAIAKLKEEEIAYGLIIAGEGPALKNCRELVDSYQLHDQIKLLGKIPWDEAPNIIASADLGFSGRIAPKYGKNYFSPLKLFEYLAMGKPVVAAARTDAEKIFAEDNLGYLFEPDDVEDLCRVLRQAYEQKNKWIDIGKQARRVVVQKHSWDARVRELISKVEEILNE